MTKRNYCLLFILCSCLTYSVCDLNDWLGENYREKKLIRQVQEIAQQEDREDSLAQMNPDYVSWLTFDEVGIHLPVVQGSDDAYYLQHAFDQTTNAQGTPFFSANSKVNDQIRIIYGHHVYYDDNAMFSPLLQLPTLDKSCVFTLDYGLYTETYQITHVFHLLKKDNAFALTKTSFMNEEDFQQWIQYPQEHNLINEEMTCTKEDSYVILQTCGESLDTFLIVIGKRV